MLSAVAMGVAMAVVSCSHGDGCRATMIKSSSFALGYYQLKVHSEIWIHEIVDNDFIDADNHADKFKAINAAHGDAGWNQKVYYYVTKPNTLLPPDFAKVDVVSNTDFDLEHPSGSSLSKLAQFLTITPYPYIKSGYKAISDWAYNHRLKEYSEIWHLGSLLGSDPKSGAGPYFPVDRKVSELTTADLMMIGMGRIQHG